MSDNGGWTTITKPKKPSGVKKPKQEVTNPVQEEGNEWDQVTVLRKKNPKKTTTVQLATTQPNTKHTTEKGVFHKLDNADAPEELKKVKLSVGQMISAERTRQGLTQKQLLTKVGGKGNLSLHDLQQLEQGTALQTNANEKIGAIERALNYRVRGKKAGEPMWVPKSSK